MKSAVTQRDLEDTPLKEKNASDKGQTLSGTRYMKYLKPLKSQKQKVEKSLSGARGGEGH